MRRLAVAALCLAPLVAAAEQMWQSRFLDVQAGVIFKSNYETRGNYTIAPVLLSLRTKPHFVWFETEDAAFVVRPQFSLLLEPFLDGVENYYIGVAAKPSFEYWFAGDWMIYGAVGGGFGVTDSGGDKLGGLGQDFTLTYQAEIGVEMPFFGDYRFRLSAFFQHWSNGGMNEENNGLEAVGPMIGLTRVW